jgi:N-acetylglucosaminyldiphosphoundecaprenol N-acetyl-beta-D-mannosaminyltransferase
MQHITYPVRHLFGLPIASLTTNETIDVMLKAIKTRTPFYHVSINASKLIKMKKDDVLMKDINNSDMLSPDGQPVVWASRMLGKPLPERVTGIDLMTTLMAIAPDHGLKIYFLGARPHVVEKVVANAIEKYGKEIVAGYHHGYLNKENSPLVANDIANSGADILLVAMPSPRKEKYLNLFRNQLNVPVVMGVGGSFDVVAGEVQRAPVIFQKTGFEWLYRFAQEPRRLWKRCVVTLFIFPFMVLGEMIKALSIDKAKIPASIKIPVAKPVARVVNKIVVNKEKVEAAMTS